MDNFLKWLENVWNLRLIFDKYLPKVKELVETIKTLQHQIAELKAFKTDLEGTGTETEEESKEETPLELEEIEDM